ncbi:hypothetical protein V3G39_01080 [Dermatophilaceae bacterium Sec6.4]
MQFEYLLGEAGWSQGVVSDGVKSPTLTASYLSDACLPDQAVGERATTTRRDFCVLSGSRTAA